MIRLLRTVCLLITSMAIFTGCTHSQVRPTPMPNINTTLEGTLTKVGKIVELKDKSGKVTQIDSYTKSFDQYNGDMVSVTGQYSGTTLFVDTVTILK